MFRANFSINISLSKNLTGSFRFNNCRSVSKVLACNVSEYNSLSSWSTLASLCVWHLFWCGVSMLRSYVPLDICFCYGIFKTSSVTNFIEIRKLTEIVNFSSFPVFFQNDLFTDFKIPFKIIHLYPVAVLGISSVYMHLFLSF